MYTQINSQRILSEKQRGKLLWNNPPENINAMAD